MEPGPVAGVRGRCVRAECVTFSLLVPLRGHAERRARMWQSIWDTTTTTPLEVVFRLDDDDDETWSWAASLEPRPRIVRGPRFAGYGSLPRFFNEMARVATGDLLMCGNDDMIFTTPEWAAQYVAAARQFPDGLFDLGCMTYPAGVFPFSCVSKQTVERLGFLNDERLTYSDIFLRDVMARFGRAVLLPQVEIYHIGVEQEVDDQVLMAVKLDLHRHAADYWALHERCVTEAVETLRNAA